MAALVMWHNHSPAMIKGVSFEMTVEYSPPNLVPKPVSVLPVYLDVMNPVGRDVDFDLPAGPSVWTRDFRLPLGGRIIGVGGHAHDFATGLALQDVTDSDAAAPGRQPRDQARAERIYPLDRPAAPRESPATGSSCRTAMCTG